MDILFRAKRPGDGIWVYGTLHITEDGGAYIINGTPADPDWEPVSPDTVGMYTGLRDKRGGMIFDGDIVRMLGQYFEVHWGEKNARFELRRLRQASVVTSTGKFLHTKDLPEGMIVGNIWDTPELKRGDRG